jgi:hypothetical protein
MHSKTVIETLWFRSLVSGQAATIRRGCSEGLKAVRAYRKDWDEREACGADNPRHDWASHGADPHDGFERLVARDARGRKTRDTRGQGEEAARRARQGDTAGDQAKIPGRDARRSTIWRWRRIKLSRLIEGGSNPTLSVSALWFPKGCGDLPICPPICSPNSRPFTRRATLPQDWRKGPHGASRSFFSATV